MQLPLNSDILTNLAEAWKLSEVKTSLEATPRITDTSLSDRNWRTN